MIETLNFRTIEVAIEAAEKYDIDLFISTNYQSSEHLPSIFQGFSNSFKEIIFQKGINFHEKYISTLEVVNKRNYDKIIVIGNDTPHLNSSIIHNAFNELDNNDIVVGPSIDGGFYLYGFKKFNREIFNQIPWLTHKVVDRLINNIRISKLKLRLLVKLDDIDSFSFLRIFRKNHPNFAQDIFNYLALFCKIKICCLENKFLMKTNLFTLITHFQLPPPVYSY